MPAIAPGAPISSATAAGGAAAVNARDRIGQGPWRNAKGAVVAKSVEDLHGPESNLTKQTALTEKGETVNGRGDTPNVHDILTGSQPDGRAFPAGDKDTTCGNWTRAAKAPPSSAITTAWACATTTPPSRGTPRTARAAAASTRSRRPAAPGCSTASRRTRHLRGNAMADKRSTKSKTVARKAAASQASAKPTLLAGGNPQIAKGYGDAPVQAYIAAMPGWKRDIGRRLDALIVRTVPGVAKAVKWNSPFYGVDGRERRKAGSSAFIASRGT